MKRYDFSADYSGESISEAPDGRFVLHSEAQARIEALEWLVEVLELQYSGFGPIAYEFVFGNEDIRRRCRDSWGEFYSTREAARAAAGV